MYTPLAYFLPFLGVELALKRSLKKLLDDLMTVHFKLICLQATWRTLTDKNWANRTLNLSDFEANGAAKITHWGK
jgi:hypothetical protein